MVLFPGSFDPFTKGHLDVLKRTLKIFPEVIILVVETKNKIKLETRVNLIKEMLDDYNITNVKVEGYSGLLVDYCKKKEINILIRGIRNEKDYFFEEELEVINKKLYNKIEVIYLMTSLEKKYISSSLVWEYLKYKQDISELVSENIKKYLENNYENL